MSEFITEWAALDHDNDTVTKREPLIRCADCDNYVESVGGNMYCKRWQRTDRLVPPEGFCHQAIPRRAHGEEG